MQSSRSEISLILSDVQSSESRDKLIRLVYPELRRIAARQFRGERIDHTLQPTALVHEAYLRLFADDPSFDNRGHFFSAAAKAMRRILVDQARRHKAEKRGGAHQRVSLEVLETLGVEQSTDYLDLHNALAEMETNDPKLAQIAEFRIFGGFSTTEIAQILSMGESTVGRDWKLAKAWLHRVMGRP